MFIQNEEIAPVIAVLGAFVQMSLSRLMAVHVKLETLVVDNNRIPLQGLQVRISL